MFLSVYEERDCELEESIQYLVNKNITTLIWLLSNRIPNDHNMTVLRPFYDNTTV